MGKHGLLRIGWTFIAKRKTTYKIVIFYAILPRSE
nr:MAG TPA: hypothetical protein [Caudoviricetes sp.]